MNYTKYIHNKFQLGLRVSRKEANASMSIQESVRTEMEIMKHLVRFKYSKKEKD